MMTAPLTNDVMHPLPSPADPGMTPKEVGAYLGCSDVTVRRLIRRGEIRAGLVGAKYRVLRFDLTAYCQRIGWRGNG